MTICFSWVFPFPLTRFNFAHCQLFLECTKPQRLFPALEWQHTLWEGNGWTPALQHRAVEQEAKELTRNTPRNYFAGWDPEDCGVGFSVFWLFFFFFGGGRVFFLILLHISLPPNYISQFAASQEVTNLQHSLSWSNTRSTMRPTTTHWSCSTYELLHLQAGLHRQTDDLFLTCVGICLLQQLGARVHICKSSNSKAVRGMQLGLKKVAAVFSNIHQLQ